MLGKIEFRVITGPDILTTKVFGDMLRFEGFEVYDLLKAEIQLRTDNSKVQDVNIICCRGGLIRYRLFKHRYKLSEQIHEGVKTLY